MGEEVGRGQGVYDQMIGKTVIAVYEHVTNHIRKTKDEWGEMKGRRDQWKETWWWNTEVVQGVIKDKALKHIKHINKLKTIVLKQLER